MAFFEEIPMVHEYLAESPPVNAPQSSPPCSRSTCLSTMSRLISLRKNANSYTIKLSPFGRAFDPGVFQSLSVAVGAAKNGHHGFPSLEFSKTELEVNDRFVDPHFTPAPDTAVVVLLRRGAKGNILPLLRLHRCFQRLSRTCPL